MHFKFKFAAFLLAAVYFNVAMAQFPNFLSALYGGGATTTPRPIVRPPKPRIDRQSIDDAFGNIPSVSNEIITAPPPPVVGSPLPNNYVVQNGNSGIGPNLGNTGPNLGIGVAPDFSSNSQFASSPSDFSDSSWPLSQPDLPKITNIQVQCEKTSIRVNIDFDRPFFGMVFSKGHFSDQNCVHLQAGSGATSTVFEIQLNQCGMTSSGGFQSNNGQPNPAGSYIESTIIVQYDPQVQEVWDQARKLRCTWYDYYEKSVTFRPFQVNMLNAVTANFLGDNLQCWMQIQSGKGPWSSEVSGIVKIGQTMTMVLGIKDEENKFDMVVRNCVAHDGKRTPIQLVNELGCVVRPKIMSKFQKIKNFGTAATVVSYAYFQAFKFPDSMNVHFQCVIQVCRYNCPEPVCPEDSAGSSVAPSVASVTVAPLFVSSDAPDSYVVNPRTPSVLPAATRRNFRANRFNARRGREEDDEIFSFSDVNGLSSKHKFNLNNQYYQSFHNHRVKRHEREMKKSNVGEVKTNSSFQVLSPDDVAFKLPSSQNFNDSVVEEAKEWVPDHSVCVTLTNTSGILFLTFMTMIIVSLITSSVITARRCYLKRKRLQKKGKALTASRPSSIAPVAAGIPPKKLLEQQQKCSSLKK